jgi:hypothetical protein
MMFFLASLAAAWAVMAGHRGWWPVLMVTASVAAQAHLMFALAVAALVLLALIVGSVDTFRARASYWWAAYGLVAGLACWLAPFIQELTTRMGNLTTLIKDEQTRRPTVGLTFGLKALTAAVQPPPLWWAPWASLPGLGVVERRSASFGVAALVLAAVALAVAVYPLRSRRTAALAAVSLLVTGAALITYSGVPVASIATNPTSLNYLMAPMFLVGVLAWLVLGSVLVLMGRRVISRVRARAAVPAGPSGGPVTEPPITAARWAAPATGFAVVTLIALTSLGIWFGQVSPGVAGDPLIHDINVASQKIERELPRQPISLSVVTGDSHFRRRMTLGLAYALTTAGYRPEVDVSYARQLGPFYEFRGTKIPSVTVYQRNSGVSVHVRKHGAGPSRRSAAHASAAEPRTYPAGTWRAG